MLAPKKLTTEAQRTLRRHREGVFMRVPTDSSKDIETREAAQRFLLQKRKTLPPASRK